MLFETIGDKNAPAVLIIHGMFCNAASVMLWAEPLADRFYLMIPTMNGHYPNAPDYISKESEAKEILAYLEAEGITELSMLHGTSMGAEVAMEVRRQIRIPVRKCIFDGGPFFHFPAPFRQIMLKKWRSMAKVISADDPEAAADKLLNSGMVKWLAGKDTEKYKKTFISMADKNRKFTETTLYNVNETCYTFDCPEMSTEAQKTFLFIYSDDEPAHMSKKKMMKHYPSADFRDMHKLGHCGFQMSKPEEYADFISAQISL